MADTRLTLRQAAAVLGVSESAIRKRVERGTLRSDKGLDGRRYVYLDTVTDNMADQVADASAPRERDALISELRAHNGTLREQLEAERNAHAEARRLLAAALERIPAIEAPQGASEASSTVSEEPERAESHPVAGKAQEGTERPQQPSGWLAPVDKLPWWHYAIGLFLGFLAGFLTALVTEAVIQATILPSSIPAFEFVLVIIAITAVTAWWPTTMFGLWIGYRKRHLRLWSQVLPLGVLVGGVTFLGMGVGTVGLTVDLLPSLLFSLFYSSESLIIVLPACLLFVSASLLANAWQRRHSSRISGATPASPLFRAGRGDGQHPRKDLSPAQQAMLGWGGTIISALITLVGTIIAVRSGP